jgi:protein TonB
MTVQKNQPQKLSVVSFISDPSITPLKAVHKITKAQKYLKSYVKSHRAIDTRPIIVDNAPEQPQLANIETVSSGIAGDHFTYSVEPPGTDNNGIVEEINEPVKPVVSKPDKGDIVNSPDVQPQFPGGIKELIKFLKRNLNSPQEMQEGEEITVRVKFIVGYNGDLMGFDVLETGGEPFDNEVIRVLQKMPKWIPGKSNNETVSTYYIIPVKFTVSD